MVITLSLVQVSRWVVFFFFVCLFVCFEGKDNFFEQHKSHSEKKKNFFSNSRGVREDSATQQERIKQSKYKVKQQYDQEKKE